MRALLKRAGSSLLRLFDSVWQYLGSLAAVCLFAAVLGLGIYHAVLQEGAPYYDCYAGLRNPPDAAPPAGLLPLGRQASPGVPHVRLEYDVDGRLQRMKHVDAGGMLTPLPGSAVAEQRLFYTPAGRIFRKENRGADGAMVEDAQGVAQREFDYDDAGRLVRMRFRDAAGGLTQPRFPGYAECRWQYDAAGRPLVEEYFDAAGKPVVNAAGEQRVEYAYAENGHSVTRRNLVNGNLADNAAGVAQECHRDSPEGSCRSWTDARGNPVLHPETGAAVLHCVTHPETGVVRQRFLGADGEPGPARGCSEHLLRCNAAGQPVWEYFGGPDGLPVLHPVRGYAERFCYYSPEGVLQREEFRDANGQPASTAEKHHVRTPAGDYILSLQKDGATTLLPG